MLITSQTASSLGVVFTAFQGLMTKDDIVAHIRSFRARKRCAGIS